VDLVVAQVQRVGVGLQARQAVGDGRPPALDADLPNRLIFAMAYIEATPPCEP
jgi:hypothetical protein